MTINTRAAVTSTTAQPLDILALYRTMVTARVTNDLLKTRKTQGRFPFYIGCAGHESMAAVVAALDESDWLALYYRDLAAWLQRTGDIYGPLREAYSRTTAPMGAGRNMPSHYSSKRHRILPTFSEVGALGPFAGGVGFSLQRHQNKEIIMYSTGEGGAATNDFNVAFRQAAVLLSSGAEDSSIGPGEAVSMPRRSMAAILWQPTKLLPASLSTSARVKAPF